MPGWDLAVDLSAGEGPLFLQIARALADDIRRGRLRAGASLPGTRALAESLGVHRNTALAAYRELIAEGWIEADARRGTFVSSALPEAAPRRFAPAAAMRQEMPSRVGYSLEPAGVSALPPPPPRGVLSLNGGIPDVRLVPAASLARAYRRALRTEGRRLLNYGDPRGSERLRAVLADMLATTRGVTATADTVMVTRGSQMALDLVARTLVAPGDVVAVESLGYRPAWEALRAAGARLVPIPLDEGGMRIEALRALVERGPVRAVYVSPHHQYPTTAVLAPGRRMELLELARRARVAVLEDDYDHEFHYDGRPILPLASADRAGVVVYFGTLSKVLAPGLRIGYVVAPEPLIERLVVRRAYTDRQGDHAVESAVAELIEDGEVQRHIRRARRAYEERRNVLVEELRRTFGDALSFKMPAGGSALWVRVPPRWDVAAWARRALEEGVSVQVGQVFAFDGRARPNLRLGFAQLTEVELREAVRRLAAARAPKTPVRPGHVRVTTRGAEL